MTEVVFSCGIQGSAYIVDVSVSLSSTVRAFRERIADVLCECFLPTIRPNTLILYLTRRTNDGKTTWLRKDDYMTKFYRDGIETTYEEMHLKKTLAEPQYFGPNFEPKAETLYVLVLTVDDPYAENKIRPSDITIGKPVDKHYVIVPIETMLIFQYITNSLTTIRVRNRPLYLLHGPRQFGKNSMGVALLDWMKSKGANVMPIFFRNCTTRMESDDKFWCELGELFDRENHCWDDESFMQVVEKTCANTEKQFCMVMTEMNVLFTNKRLATKFLRVLDKWRGKPYFRGFVGIGSHELVHYREFYHTKSTEQSLFGILQLEPFTVEQMKGFFKLLEPDFEFSESIKNGIMDHSCGAPGLFMSLIRYTLEIDISWATWQEWEKSVKRLGHAPYIRNYSNSYRRMYKQMSQLTELQWNVLRYILENNKCLTASTIEEYCGVPVRKEHGRRLVDPLLELGIVMETKR